MDQHRAARECGAPAQERASRASLAEPVLPAGHQPGSGPLLTSSASLLALQRAAGNAAVVRGVAVQRSIVPGALRNDEGTPEQIAAAIKNDDPGDVKAINNFSQAKAGQKADLVEVLLRQTSLMTFDKRAITRIFNSYGDLESLDAGAVSQLRRCKDRGYDLSDLSRFGNLKVDFKAEVKKEALANLSANIELLLKEGKRLGVSDGLADKPATAEQTAAIAEQQQLAHQIQDSKKLLAACRNIVVAKHGFLGAPDREAKIGDPIRFDPGAEPVGPGIDPVKLTSPASHEMPWKAVYAQYSALSQAVASVLNKNPALYALTSLTEEAADEKPGGGKDPHLNFGQQRITGLDAMSPEAARKKIGDAMTEVYNNARFTMAKVMSGQIPALQLDSVINRFRSGDYGSRWATPYAKLATSAAVEDEGSSFDKTMAGIGLALLLASVAIGTAGGATPILGAILAGANIASGAAAAAIATLKAQDLTKASQSAVTDQTGVVSPAQAGKAELDAIMYQFAAIAAVAGEGAGMLLSAPAKAGGNLGVVSKMSAAERTNALVDALQTMEPGQVALRTGLPPDEILSMIAPQAAKDPASAAAANKLREFLNKFSAPLTGPLSKGEKLSAMLREAKMTFREYWMKVYGLGLRQVGDVTLHGGFGDAELEYIRLIETTPGREAGIYRNARTGEHAVVQGAGDWNQGVVPHMNGLPGAGGDRWLLVEHYHPERNWAVQFPSGFTKNGAPAGDFAVLLQDYGETNIAGVFAGQPSSISQRVSARIRFRDPATGNYHFTTYGYDPSHGPIGAFFVTAETETGALIDYSFGNISGIAGARADYERHMAGIARGTPVVKARP
jgi:hypothetical protein